MYLPFVTRDKKGGSFEMKVVILIGGGVSIGVFMIGGLCILGM